MKLSTALHLTRAVQVFGAALVAVGLLAAIADVARAEPATFTNLNVPATFTPAGQLVDTVTGRPAYYGPAGQPGSPAPSSQADAFWIEPGGAAVFYDPASWSYANPHRPANTPVDLWRCDSYVTWTLAGDGTSPQIAAINRAVEQVATGSGERYRYTSGPADVTITVTGRDSSQLLNIDGTADQGYTAPTLDRIDLLDTSTPTWLLPLTLHELMLSRDLRETPDGFGGHLGHFTSSYPFYTATDLGLLRSTPCQGGQQ